MVKMAGLLGFSRQAMACVRQYPARHHEALIAQLQEVADGRCDRLMVQMPPGSGEIDLWFGVVSRVFSGPAQTGTDHRGGAYRLARRAFWAAGAGCDRRAGGAAWGGAGESQPGGSMLCDRPRRRVFRRPIPVLNAGRVLPGRGYLVWTRPIGGRERIMMIMRRSRCCIRWLAAVPRSSRRIVPRAVI